MNLPVQEVLGLVARSGVCIVKKVLIAGVVQVCFRSVLVYVVLKQYVVSWYSVSRKCHVNQDTIHKVL
jgi:hypothetical protein